MSADGEQSKPAEDKSKESAEKSSEDDSEAGGEEETWWYLDTSQNVQGPFTWEQMEAWFKGGFLQQELPVRHSCHANTRQLL